MNDQSPSKAAVPPVTEGEPLGTMDILGLLQRLPHRYPFLMVDRVIGIRGEDFGIGIKNVTYNEPQFTGHFPGVPIFPGVLLVEGMAQTAAAIYLSKQDITSPPLVYFMSIDRVKFRKTVHPGDTVEYHMQKLKRRSDVWRFGGLSKVNGVVVAEAEITAMVVRK
jgi:3-hydroxyacyl-[acyl-carrier-protein] dehydratase